MPDPTSRCGIHQAGESPSFFSDGALAAVDESENSTAIVYHEDDTLEVFNFNARPTGMRFARSGAAAKRYRPRAISVRRNNQITAYSIRYRGIP